MNILCPKCNARVESHNSFANCGFCGATFAVGDAKTTADAAPPDPLIGATIGNCKIIERIGSGGMGVVYKAEQLSLGRLVAVKLLPEALRQDEQIRDRFQREITILAKLNHPNIVSILDGGISEHGGYFIMEFVDGVPLRKIMATQDALTAVQSLKIIPQVCEALEYAHSIGIIHRDIKPENILIDRAGRVRLLDFGLSRISKHDEPGLLTRATQVLGTFEYMAPEQREASRNVDHRADLYSLGVVIYEMLTGELPIGRFDPPSYKNIQVDVRLDEVVLRVLDKSPDRRYQRASDLKSEVERISSSPPVVAPPVLPNVNITNTSGASRPPSTPAAPANANVPPTANTSSNTNIPPNINISGVPFITAKESSHRGIVILTILLVAVSAFQGNAQVGAVFLAGAFLYASREILLPAPRRNVIALWVMMAFVAFASIDSQTGEFKRFPIYVNTTFPYLWVKPWIRACLFIVILARLTKILESDFKNPSRTLMWIGLGFAALLGTVASEWIFAVALGAVIVYGAPRLLDTFMKKYAEAKNAPIPASPGISVASRLHPTALAAAGFAALGVIFFAFTLLTFFFALRNK